jgi:hypothetical protein
MAIASSPEAVRRLSRFAALEAMVVEDVDGRRWVRLPEAFRALAELCQQTAEVVIHGERFQATCTSRVLWVAGNDGLCGEHIRAALVLA